MHAARRVRPHLSHRALRLVRSTSAFPARLPQNGLSRVQGESHPPLFELTLPQYWKRHILEPHGDLPALISRHEKSDEPGGQGCLRWDFRTMDERVDEVARGLIKMGIEKGDRVAILMGNNSAYATLQWATARIGAILVCLNPAYTPSSLVSLLGLVGAKALFLVPSLRTSTYLGPLSELLPGLKTGRPHELQEEALPELKSVVLFGVETDGYDGVARYEDVRVEDGGLGDGRLKARAKDASNEDVINMQFTSGTTGLPKAVCLTHRNLLNNGLQIGDAMRLTPDDILVNPAPLFHCFGICLGNLAAWTHGSTIVYAANSFDPRATLEAVVQERATALHGVPTHFISELAILDQEEAAGRGAEWDFSTLRTGIAAGSPVPMDLMRRLIKRINLTQLTNAYGMTETSPVSFQTQTDDPLIKRVETVGRIRPHLQAKIVQPGDPEGKALPVGTPGELCVAGYSLQKGYWKNEEQTNAMIQTHPGDGETKWLHTGDECIMDEEGYLRVVGRIKDLIIRGGENIFPVVVENCLDGTPGIYEASIIAVPDAVYGEVVGAWVVRTPDDAGRSLTREDVRARVSKGVAGPQAAPAWVWFVGEDGAQEELPKTLSGKVQKNVLREWSKALAAKEVGKVQKPVEKQGAAK